MGDGWDTSPDAIERVRFMARISGGEPEAGVPVGEYCGIGVWEVDSLPEPVSHD